MRNIHTGSPATVLLPRGAFRRQGPATQKAVSRLPAQIVCKNWKAPSEMNTIAAQRTKNFSHRKIRYQPRLLSRISFRGSMQTSVGNIASVHHRVALSKAALWHGLSDESCLSVAATTRAKLRKTSIWVDFLFNSEIRSPRSSMLATFALFTSLARFRV